MNNLTQIIPLGESAILIRFAKQLDEQANKKAIEFAAILKRQNHAEIKEVTASLVSVLVKYDNQKISFFNLSGLIRLALCEPQGKENNIYKTHKVKMIFDGKDLADVTNSLSLNIEQFIATHNEKPLRVLATGFAPGFIYCGMHKKSLFIDRRQKLHKQVPKGTVIFAAGQTAITSSPIPTGWHIIGHSDFSNFDENKNPPILINAGDRIKFVSIEK